MPATRRGSSVPQLQNYTEHYDPENGWTKEWEWEGQEPLWVAQYAAQFQRAGCATNLSVKFGIGRLMVNDTTGATTIDRWEVGVEEVSKSSLFNPRNIANISAGDLDIIADFVNGATGESYSDVSDSLSSDAAKRLLYRVHRGSTDFQFESYVLRHTTNVSNRYAANISDINQGLIYTSAQLFSEVQDANLWIFPLPGRQVYKLQAIVAPDFQDNYLWGWLKSGGTEQSAANQRVNIATLYKLDQWSTDEYGTV